MLVINPAFYLPCYVLHRDPQGYLSSYELLNRTGSCELAGDFISLYPSMSTNPIQSHRVLVEISFNTFWHFLTNGDVFGSVKCLQSHLTYQSKY
jgi:hypothetical protein